MSFFLLMIFVYSCRKSDLLTTQHEDVVELSKMDLAAAKSYYENLKKEEGVNVDPPALDRVLRQDRSLKAVNNKKYAMFKKAYVSETYESTFVEVPISYDQRFSLVMTNPANAKPVTNFEQIEIFKYSFDRLVIYKSKRTGEINRRLISYIPNISYLKKHNYKISHNQINRLDPDFTGFLQYKNWDGTPLYLLQYENGKKTRYISLKKQINTESVTAKGKSSDELSTSKIVCNYFSVPIWGESCIGAGPEGSAPHCTPYIRGYTTISICKDDGLTGNPCVDFGICGNPGNPPGGGGGPTNPGHTGDPCLDYGDCGGSTADCAGVLNGSAVMTPCGCIGGTTGIPNCTTRDIIDSLGNYPCASSILAQLPFLKNDISGLINNTFNGNCDQHVKFVSANIPNGPNGGFTDGDFEVKNIEFKNGFNWNAGYIYESTIRINEDVLNYSTKEYMLVTMYHEALHAFLSVEKIRLGGTFSLVYPDININFINLNNTKFNRNEKVFLNGHSQMGLAFFNGLKSAISNFNPNLPDATVSAMAASGIYTTTPSEIQLNSNERDVRNHNYKGTKCP